MKRRTSGVLVATLFTTTVAATAPWTAAFPFRRDSDYLQFEYACHEGNYSVPNALGGARQDERADAR